MEASLDAALPHADEAPPSTSQEDRRAQVAARYRDKTGACLTCQATAECTGFKKLVCRWCEETEDATDESDDESEEEDA
jgi:hypothetical protein